MRFNIRDVLWLTVVVGMALRWWIDRTKSQEDRAPLMQSHENLQEIRQMLGSEEKLGELITMARAYNLSPARPSTLVISMTDGSRSTNSGQKR
jgi:hypothetical protein